MQFLLVYIKEAHALDSSRPNFNGPMVEDPISDLERQSVAKTCMSKLELKEIPSVVDRIDDKVNKAYSGWPDRLYLVGKDGKIAYSGGQGPFNFSPDELEKSIRKELKKIKKEGTQEKVIR